MGVMNQVGGTHCAHPVVRGLLVPLPSNWAPADADEDPLCNFYSASYDLDLVRDFLHVMDLEEFFEPLSVSDIPRAIPGVALAEAWVPVRVRADLSVDALLYPFAGERMILTYENSD